MKIKYSQYLKNQYFIVIFYLIHENFGKYTFENYTGAGKAKILVLDKNKRGKRQ